jgi:glycosyltransferase involved in cell wall biosynthesis/2-polyprenyl-3-methyl-5-hydroxy-6-metoxy-1,4-benzoquinol methylase/GT2 family glycosyltransferase
MHPEPAPRGDRVALLTAVSASGEVGGAERFYADLAQALRSAGCTVDEIAVPTDESSFEAILDGYDRCRAMDLSAYDVVISTKSPTYNVRHPQHVVYLVHTVRVFYDQFDATFPVPTPELLEQRRRIHRLDTESLAAAARRFAIGHEVASRLRRFNGLDAEVLHPPLGSDRFRPQPAEDFFFLPGRLHPWKRIDLVIRAVLASREPLRLVVAGTGEAEAALRSLAAGDPRIEFLGRVYDDRLVDLYGRCLAVPFVPIREDYGYVTLEAFASGKPVITCTDSGEPLQFVAHRRTGLVCEPTPESIRDAMQACRLARAEAQAMGMRAREIATQLAWPAVVDRLLHSGGDLCEPTRTAGRASSSERTRVAVLDMQPITPAIGGGRLRLLGLYHALGDDFETRYVGSYDWPGEPRRRQQLTSTLEEIVVPLSDDHHAAARRLSEAAGGKTVIDIAFPRLGHLSADYLLAAREAVDWADVVVFSHPWVYPLVAERVRQSQLVVYDSHNVEGFLRAQLLDSAQPVERDLLRGVLAAEYRLGSRADVVLACSADDRARFHRIYEWPFSKMRVVPNGVMVTGIRVATPDERRQAKRELGLDPARRLALFIGSPYGPNVQAAAFIATELAPAVPEIDFVIAGGVGDALPRPGASNVHVTGQVSEERKLQWLRAADFGVNPMSSGSGTNIKMFDLMAAGLPTVTTAVGARGIERAGGQPFVVAGLSVQEMAGALRRLCAEPAFAAERARDARACVEDGYSWERISPALGNLIRARLRRDTPPYFCVVVPTYERHAQLDALMGRLEAQSMREFEVVVVDQSACRWPNARLPRGFSLTYIHTDVRGAVRARNTGADCARGQVIAFTDDDCLPEADWLQSARRYFDVATTVGVEGAIESDHIDDPAYRPVTNSGFEGIGFMTANLFVRSEAFHRLNGFDLDFDRPHFREDTDFGWRLQELGDVPYGRDVRVFHPAQPRSIERESEAARARFFEKDALLLAKHPRRYRELFEREGHGHKTPGFWENFERGAVKYGVDVSGFRCLARPAANATAGEQGADRSDGMTKPNGDLLPTLLAHSQIDLPLRVPPRLTGHLQQARALVAQVAEVFGGAASGDYFSSSRLRYEQYFAVAMTLPDKARVLEVGSAPGHVSVGLFMLGFELTCINLNAEYRKFYPSRDWLDRLNVREHDFEQAPLPFADESFDAVFFTEVLEHVAIRHPRQVLADFWRLLRPGGQLILSTPNVCNVSNVVALLNGTNIFWPPELFYGSLDRHNREFTPDEVREVLAAAGFADVQMYGINCWSNWRQGGAGYAAQAVAERGDGHPLLRNTIMAIARRG